MTEDSVLLLPHDMETLVITDNVFIPFVPPDWFGDGWYGFWWNMSQAFPWLPQSNHDWNLFFAFWAISQTYVLLVLWTSYQRKKANGCTLDTSHHSPGSTRPSS